MTDRQRRRRQQTTKWKKTKKRQRKRKVDRLQIEISFGLKRFGIEKLRMKNRCRCNERCVPQGYQFLEIYFRFSFYQSNDATSEKQNRYFRSEVEPCEKRKEKGKKKMVNGKIVFLLN